MPQAVRLWTIGSGDSLEELTLARLDLEERIEKWIERDISIVSSDLLVIGRQVDTEFGGSIDLLCLDRDGNTVIIELKRDRTPREVTAQILDYACWVRELTSEKLEAIASAYLHDETSLEKAFRERFEEDLPEVLNESHSMLIVAPQMDASTERIIEYLSDAHGVSINSVSFQYFKSDDGRELLARVFLLEPERVEHQRKVSKRRRHLPYEELEQMADSAEVGDLYRRMVSGIGSLLKRDTTASSIRFSGDFDGSRLVVFSLLPGRSSKVRGLHFQLYFERFCNLFGVDPDVVARLLPNDHERWSYTSTTTHDPHWSGFSGYFATEREVETFLEGLRRFSDR